jgi:hypothetical protein
MKNVQYMIFNPKDCPDEGMPRLNALIKFWRTSWERVFRDLGVHREIVADEIFRQEYVTGLFFEEEPICFHSYSCFNLDIHGAFDQVYFRNYPKDGLEALRNQGYRRVATMEYLVSSRARARLLASLGVPAPVIVGELGCWLLFDSLPIERIVTVARRIPGVRSGCESIGGVVLAENLMMNNAMVDLVMFPRQRSAPIHSDPMTMSILKSLWAKRIDYTFGTSKLKRVDDRRSYGSTSADSRAKELVSI